MERLFPSFYHAVITPSFTLVAPVRYGQRETRFHHIIVSINESFDASGIVNPLKARENLQGSVEEYVKLL